MILPPCDPLDWRCVLTLPPSIILHLRPHAAIAAITPGLTPSPHPRATELLPRGGGGCPPRSRPPKRRSCTEHLPPRGCSNLWDAVKGPLGWGPKQEPSPGYLQPSPGRRKSWFGACASKTSQPPLPAQVWGSKGLYTLPKRGDSWKKKRMWASLVHKPAPESGS